MTLHRPLPGTVPAFLLLVLAGAANAQGPGGDSELPQVSAQDALTPAAASDRAAGPDADPADPPGDTPGGETRAPGQPSPPPPDYEASEQIREDLPVSFPVDI